MAVAAVSASRRRLTPWTSPHICGRSRRRGFQLKRKSRSDRVRSKIAEIKKEALRRRMHETIDQQGAWLGMVLRGFMPITRFRPTQRPCGTSAITSPTVAACATAAHPEGCGDVRADGRATGSMDSKVAHYASCRQTSEVGTRCGNPARRDLCGGCAVMGIPTAIKIVLQFHSLPLRHM
jgi:hypothetical protein